MINHNGKTYICLLDFAMDFIRGKWKAILLCHLYDEPKRFLELQRITSGISQKVLNENLKELINDELIDKIIYAEIPPKVEYFLTDKGQKLTKIIKEIEEWSISYYSHLDSKCTKSE
ncbi:winged helix-turn-helix transcriptional regulator [Clostridium lacusfryxellense]|uniref:winged helix-turn-helix transcriptional regulator n=1 Tax=Clostridium lacusfryxellense TaxID=205328 RepID=UPI001C0DB683|nr:helix-turn-helix domain-containing protein [Clostridium lacusfryxellense]MBU3110961.1 helix-turn-helix transcriptional regulator [Clostridium lacusfryxellense]